MSRWATRGVALVVGIILMMAGSSTRALGAFVVLLAVVGAVVSETARRRGSQRPGAFSRQFAATREATWQALVAVVHQRGYRDVYVDEHDRELSFNTGMSLWTWAGQDFQAAVTTGADEATTQVSLRGATSSRGLGAIQSFSWGEGKRLGNGVLDGVQEELAKSDPPDTLA